MRLPQYGGKGKKRGKNPFSAPLHRTVTKPNRYVDDDGSIVRYNVTMHRDVHLAGDSHLTLSGELRGRANPKRDGYKSRNDRYRHYELAGVQKLTGATNPMASPAQAAIPTGQYPEPEMRVTVLLWHKSARQFKANPVISRK